jgi:D-alanyl-D-alanine endopeptidase (penicillin-binding protein 7)
LKSVKLWAGLGLLLVVGVGFAREQSDMFSETQLERPTLNTHSAEPVFVPDLTYLSAGPWITCQIPSKLRPRLRAHAACVVDCNSGKVLYGLRSQTPRPIASLVKLLTAMVYLESGGDLEATIEITHEDARNAGKSILWKGHRFKAEDVLYAALISSENRAARALARSTPYTQEQFIERMQQRAKELGCATLRVVEPTGLSEKNVASPEDVARLLAAALSNQTISKICRTYRHQFKALNSRKTYRLTNSNRLLVSKYRMLGGKTGYIVEAGWCVAAMNDTPSGPLITVIMGSQSNNVRFTQARKLIDWAIRNRREASMFAVVPQP